MLTDLIDMVMIMVIIPIPIHVSTSYPTDSTRVHRLISLIHFLDLIDHLRMCQVIRLNHAHTHHHDMLDLGPEVIHLKTEQRLQVEDCRQQGLEQGC